MVAALLLQKKRLVSIIEQACGSAEDAGSSNNTQQSRQQGISWMAPPSKRRRTESVGAKAVRFADSAAQERTFNIYQECQTEEDRQKVRETIWYTRRDFDDFLLDRVQTIRVWRSVGGDMNELHDHYCLRGLEPYQSSSLNAEMHSQRNLYINGILNEQRRLRAQAASIPPSSKGRARPYDPFAVASLVSHISDWAMQQARRLALLDEEEATRIQREALYRSSSFFQLPPRRRRSSASRRFSTTSLPPASEHCGGFGGVLPPRLSALGGSPHHKNALATAPRANVDITLLKEMNLQFLQQVMANRRGDDPLPKQRPLHPRTPKDGSIIDGGSNTMSLNALLWTSNRSNSSHNGSSCYAHLNSAQLRPGATTTGRRHSLQFNPAEQNESNMPQPFLLIRRDSLHGLVPSHQGGGAHAVSEQPSSVCPS